MPEKYRRWQEMEIKHGRIAMLATLHVIVTGAGYKWSGYCSYLSFPPLKFDDIPAGTLGARLEPHIRATDFQSVHTGCVHAAAASRA